MNILIIEDDKRISSFLYKGLKGEGYGVSVAYNGEEGLNMALDLDFDLVILDIMLPKMDGIDVLKRIRASKGDIPVIMLTAKGDLETKVASFDSGANDYLTKPFAFEELSARVRAQLRSMEQQNTFLWHVGSLTLDIRSREVTVNNRKVALTSKEFSLLEYLMRHKNQVVSRSQILQHVWGYDFDPESNIVDVFIRHIRQKLEVVCNRQVIETVKGIGYKFITE